jgi:hypothetical protein
MTTPATNPWLPLIFQPQKSFAGAAGPLLPVFGSSGQVAVNPKTGDVVTNKPTQGTPAPTPTASATGSPTPAPTPTKTKTPSTGATTVATPPIKKVLSTNHFASTSGTTKAYVQAVIDKGQDPNSGDAGATLDNSGNAVNDLVNWVQPNGNEEWRFNPPLHKSTRGVNLRDLTAQGLGFDDNFVFNSDYRNQTKEWFNNRLDDEVRNLPGYMFQDPDYKLFTNGNTIYGFQFHYNPTSYSEAYTNDPTLDWTAGDKAVPLSGTGTISVSLMLNRIVDMHYLANGGSGTPSAYSRQLTNEEVVGIRNMGTLYDIDFIFRMTNGDPIQGSPQHISRDLTSSNYGYLTGVPLWAQLGQNMRYRVSITSLNITHLIFTHNMIPMLSQVDLTLARYPVVDQAGYMTKDRVTGSQTFMGKPADKTSDTTPPTS